MTSFMPELVTPAPKNKKRSELKRAASASTTHKKSKSSINKVQGTISIDNVGSGQVQPPSQPVEPAVLPMPLQD